MPFSPRAVARVNSHPRLGARSTSRFGVERLMAPTRLRVKAAVIGVLAAMAVLGPLALPAAAHAVLVASSPGDQAAMDGSPGEVRFEFSEPIDADLGGVRVFDREGTRIDRGAARVETRTVAIDLEPDLADGAYVATYRVISADGHPVRGGIVFTVGEVAAADAEIGIDQFFGRDADRGWELFGALGRWLAMAGIVLAAGGAAFVMLCNPTADNSSRRVIRTMATVGAIGAVIAVPVQAALGTGQGIGSLFEPGVFTSVLDGGLGWSTALGLSGLAVVAVSISRSSQVAVLGGVVALGSLVFVGHNRFDDVAIGTIADLVHLGAAAIWAGGLVLLLVALRSEIAPTDRARIVGRFSGLATVSIVAVGAAGVVMSWAEVRSVSALTSTAYGWTLIAKVIVVGLVVVAGAYNHYRLVPHVSADANQAAAWNRLKTSVVLEVVGVVVALGLTAVLVNLIPARVDAGIGQLHSEILELGSAGSVQLVVDPNRAGENTVHLYFYAPDGRPAEIAEDVSIAFTKPSDDIGPIERIPFRAGPAHFQLDGSELVSGGRWDITVIARISRFAEETSTADVLVGG